MIKWALWTVLVLAAVGAFVVLVGWRLPRAHVASRTIEVPVTPNALYALLTDVDRYPSWRSDVKTIDRLPDRNGLPAWVEHSSSGALPLAFERMQPPLLLVGRITDPSLPFGGTWTYTIKPANGGSELTITENGEIYNPVFRFMSRFVFGYNATIDAFMKAVQTKCGA